MKCPARISHGIMIAGFLLFSAGLPTIEAKAATSGNPYSGIVERNSFGLKPPVNPADLVKPPPPVVADIKLQGITTILGRKQVLMKVKVPAKPPEPAREQSFVFVEGQREGEVEVKEIDPVEGVVKVDNAGTLLALNLKDHGDRPTPGAALPTAPAGARPSNLPGAIPPPANPVIPPAGSPSASTSSIEGFGGNKTLPQRDIRTGVTGGMGSQSFGVRTGNPTANAADALAAQQEIAKQRTPEENVILYEANRLRREQSGNGFIKFPPHPALKGTQNQ